MIALVVMALAVVYGVIGIDYTKQLKVRETTTFEISDITQNLKQIPAPPQNLEQRLAAAQARLATARSAFPGKPNSTQVIYNILWLADECQVKAIPLTTQQWSADKAGKGYLVFRLHIAVQGGFSEVVNFLGRLENGDFGTLTIENLVVSRIIGKADGTSSVAASLDVAIYAKSAISD